MKDLLKLADKCMAELDALGIKYCVPKSWNINHRAKHRFGQCRRVSPGVFEIDISAFLLDDSISDIPAMNTVIHELLHTVKGCSNHGERWKFLAAQVNSAYPKYSIKRASTWEEFGITPPAYDSAYHYMIECTSCGTRSYRKRATKVTQNPANYRCRCGGKLRVTKIN